MILLLLALALMQAAPPPQPTAVLKTPISTSVTSYKIDSFTYHRGDYPEIAIGYSDNLNKPFYDNHRTNDQGTGKNDAITMIEKINKSNFSVNSLETMLLQHLIDEGKIPPATISTVSGTKK